MARHGRLHRLPGADAHRRRRRGSEAPLVDQGRARDRQDLAGSLHREGPRGRALNVARQVDDSTKDGLYVYDAVQRLYDSRFQDRDVSDIRQYIRMGPLGQAFRAERRVVLLIDEIDKADVEFPNDLLHELDAMSFTVAETGERVSAKERPVVIITSNSEKELPDAFLRRAVFHYISFPDASLMAEIVGVHFPDLGEGLLTRALEAFYALRGLEGLRKRPSTSELIDWIAALIATGVDPESLTGPSGALPYLGTLLKREQDLAVAMRRRR